MTDPGVACRLCGQPRGDGYFWLCPSCGARRIQRQRTAAQELRATFPALPVRIVNMLIRRDEPLFPDEVRWLTDKEFLSLRNAGKAALTQFRASVPRPKPAGSHIPNWVGEGLW